MARTWVAASLIALLGGCAGQTTQYQVSVVNRGSKPVTLWLLKDNSFAQKGWVSREQVAMSNPAATDHLPDVVVPPGKTATRPSILATFLSPRGHAVLRVYNGTPSLNEMLATNRGDLDRLDLVLDPGLNAFVISDQDGGLNATRQNAPAVHP